MNKVSVSKERLIGRAGELLVCADLMTQGYYAFLAEPGFPYDVLIDINGKIKKVEVKTTQRLIKYDHAQYVYRFNTRRRKGMGGRLRTDIINTDYFAFVVLDGKKIAYFKKNIMISRTGSFKQIMDFKSRGINYKGRVYSNGTVRKPEWGRYLEDYAEFKP